MHDFPFCQYTSELEKKLRMQKLYSLIWLLATPYSKRSMLQQLSIYGRFKHDGEVHARQISELRFFITLKMPTFCSMYQINLNSCVSAPLCYSNNSLNK